MPITKGLCPRCGAVLEVESTEEASICAQCGAPFITGKAVVAYGSQFGESTDTDNDPDLLPGFYNITIERKHHAMMGRAITYLISIDGEVAALNDGDSLNITTNRRNFNFPALKTNNNDIYVEGALTGAADGRDIYICVDVTMGNGSFAKLLSSTNPTVRFR